MAKSFLSSLNHIPRWLLTSLGVTADSKYLESSFNATLAWSFISKLHQNKVHCYIYTQLQNFILRFFRIPPQRRSQTLPIINDKVCLYRFALTVCIISWEHCNVRLVHIAILYLYPYGVAVRGGDSVAGEGRHVSEPKCCSRVKRITMWMWGLYCWLCELFIPHLGV